MPHLSAESLIGRALSNLPERSRTVLSRRFALDGRQTPPAGRAGETLQAIGDDYGLTRERVRQIESDALKILRASRVLKELAAFSRPTESHLRSWGGLRREERLYDELREDLGFQGKPQHFNFLLTVTDPFMRHTATEHHHHLWTVEEEAARNAKRLLILLQRELSKINSPKSYHELCELARELCSRERLLKNEKTVSRFAASTVDAASFIGSNPFGEYGLRSWERIQPKNTGERAFLILEKEGKPLHFREISRRIGKTWGRDTHHETVHNELIKDPRFVLVGRGLYALSEWGFQPGTVSDVIADMLEARGKPLERAEILGRVLKARLVKPSTILLALSNRSRFSRTPEGKYTLRR